MSLVIDFIYIMCKVPQTSIMKRDFIADYNPEGTELTALSNAFDAALQRNKLYDFDTSQGRRKEIKIYCMDEILRISKKYEKVVSVEDFEKDILELQASMNERYGRYFEDGGFKISHAQKSLSVFLKIQWASRRHEVPPPLCPVDRKILIHAGERNPDAWTKVITMPEYRRHIRILKNASRGHGCNDLACWELYSFQLI
jgi:hypothetical protein